MKLKNILTAVMVACSLCAWADDEIMVGTYNIRMGVADGGTPNAWPARKSDLVKFIAKLDMDVFGMQEVMPSQARYITNSLPQYAMIGDYREANRVSGEASPVCYRKERFDVLKSGTFWLSETPDIPGKKGWGAACPRVCTWAILKDRQTGKVFTFANAHTDHKSALARKEGMILIVRRMQEFSPSGVPIVFVGDHNCRETDEPSQAVSKVLVNSFYSSKTPPEGSWRTLSCWKWFDKELPAVEALKFPIEERNSKTFKGGARIDYIYVSKGVEVLCHKTHSDSRPGTQLYPSDHFPVTAKLSLPSVK